MNVHAIALRDQVSQLTGIDIRLLLFLLESELQHLTLEFGRTLATRLCGEQGAETHLPERFLDPIKALAAEAKLPARLDNGSLVH